MLFFSGNKDFNSNQDEDGNYDWILDETPRGDFFFEKYYFVNELSKIDGNVLY